MTNQLSDRINNLATSATLAMAAKARELRGEGKDVIGLSLGEPDFNTPDFIKQAAIDAVNENYNSYTPVDGYAELKQAIITKFKRDNDLTYEPSQIVVSTGAKQALYNLAQVCLNPGDEVVLPCPYWVSYSDIVKLAEGVPVEVPTSIDTDFKMTPGQLRAAITPKTKWLILNSPSNPTGFAYTHNEIKALTEVLMKYPHIYILSDDMYEHLVYDNFEFATGQSQIPKISTFSSGFSSDLRLELYYNTGFTQGPCYSK